MKNYVYYLSPVLSVISKSSRFLLTSFLVLFGLIAQAQFSNVAVTGYNSDVVANGATGVGTNSTTADVDGGGFVFVTTDFNPGGGICGTAANSLPTTNLINSLTNAGLTYTLQPYNANNSLRLASGTSGLLTLTSPTNASNIYLLATGGSGACAITATINFSDATTQVITGSAADWCSGTSPATAQYYRITRTSATCNGALCQYLYDVNLVINPANYTKTINSISIASTGGILHVMGVGKKTPPVPCPTPGAQATALNLSSPSGTVVNGTFAAAAGSPSGYLTVVYLSGVAATAPTSGIDYTIGTNLGNGKVVGTGASTSFSAAGLFPGVTYDFYTYSYNTGACATAYNTTLPLFGTISTSNLGATTIINPFGDGGFQTGATFAANGWTVLNAATGNAWQTGTPASTYFASRHAYISSDGGTTHGYSNSSATEVYFYRDVTFPAGQTEISLSFNWVSFGNDAGFDFFQVAIGPTSIVPIVNQNISGSLTITNPLIAGTTVLVSGQNANTLQTANVCIPPSLTGNQLVATTMRLIFIWRTDPSVGTNPPAAVDNIGLVSSVPVGPTAQPTALTLTTISTSQINGSFTAATGSPTGYVVVRYPAGSTPTAPLAGTTYVAGNTLGSGPNTGTVVQSGVATTFNATGLSGGTSYDFYVYSFKTATCTGPVYLGTFSSPDNLKTASTTPCGTLNGNIPVGPTAPASPAGFPTLTAALTYINTNGLGGATILELQPNYVSTTETYPITFPANPCVGAINTLTIRPAASVVSTLSISSSNTTATIDLNGAQYVTIDGRPGGTGTAKRLSIINTSTAALATIRLINEASNNLITTCDVQGASTLSNNPTTSGVIFIGSTSGFNGNDNNTILSCDIHGFGATLPSIGIGANNSTTAGALSNNDNNSISGCNIYDFFNGAAATTGIKIDAGNNNTTITNNRLYQTATRTFTTASAFRFIWLNPNSAAANVTFGSGNTVTGNFLGYAQNDGTGVTTITFTGTGATAPFVGMDISVGNGTGTLVQNNTITNISFTSPNIATVTTGQWSGISVNYGNVTNITNNIIGASGSGIQVVSTGATNATLINGIRVGGGILTNTISNNSIGNITGNMTVNTAAHTIVGINLNGGTPSTTVSNNNIGPLTSGTLSTTSTGIVQVIGISTSVALVTPSFTGNNIHDLSNFAINSSTSGTGNCVMGININNTLISTTCNISSNIISNLRSTANTTLTTFAPSIHGISLNTATTATITVNGNFIHSFSAPNWLLGANTATGIPVFGGINTVSNTNVTLTNNMIRLGIDAAGAAVTQPISFRGIYRQAISGNFITAHNSVYIGGTGVTPTSGNAPSAAYYRQGTATSDILQDNIFANVRTNALVGGKHYTVFAGANTNITVNYNVYQTQGGLGNLFGFNGTVDVTSYSSGAPWIAGDVNSQSNDPRFINPTGNAASLDLHINASQATPVEAKGIAVASVTTDFDGQTRSGLTPVDIGADAGNFIAQLPCVTPNRSAALSLTPVSNSQINGTITPGSGSTDAFIVIMYPAPAANVIAPANGFNYAVGSTLGGGTIISSGPSTTFSATGLLGDVAYTFYIYSYNSFCSGGPLYNSIARIQTASTLGCSGLTGTIPVGPTAPASPAGFANLTSALAYLNVNGLSGPTILELQNDYVSTTETYPITIGKIACNTSVKTLTIRPALGATGKTITTGTATTTLYLNGANYVTIDGRPGGTGGTISVPNSSYLTISNTNTLGVAVKLENEAHDNTIKYCDLQGQNSSNGALPGVAAGVVFIGATNGLNGNDNITIDNNNIHSTGTANTLTMGVYSFGPGGSTTLTSNFNDNNTISNNNIYDIFGTVNLSTAGIELEKGTNAWTITGNSFFQTVTRTVALTAGISNKGLYIIPTNTGGIGNGFTITGNYFGGMAPQCGGNNFSSVSTAATNNNQYQAMFLSVAGGTVTNVRSNTINNFFIGQGTSTGDLFHAIWTASTGNINIGGPIASDGNTIGTTTSPAGTSTGITLNSGSAAPAHMILINGGTAATTNVLIQNNKIGGITIKGLACPWSGIFANSTATVTIANNLIGSTTVANSILADNTGATTAVLAMRGINIPSGSPTVTINNNTIANLTNLSVSTGSGSQTAGIMVVSTTAPCSSISGNTIFNLACSSTHAGGSASAALEGIGMFSTVNACNITGNNIYNLVSTSTSTSTAILMEGIFFNGNTTVASTISKNFVHSFNLTAVNPSLSIRGIECNGGTLNAYNNMVRLGINAAGASITTPISIYAVLKSSTARQNFYHNTVYIGGAGVTAGTQPTYAFWRLNAATVSEDVKNNIFINARSGAGTGKHYAVFIAAGQTANLAINYNIYRATGTNGFFAFNGASDVPVYTLGWIAGDINSFSDDPMLLNPTGNVTTVNLHINPAIATRVEQFGTSIPFVVDDIDNETRGALSPDDIGADAGIFTALFTCGGSPLATVASLTDNTLICGSGSKTIILTGLNATPGLSYQWKESSTGLPGDFTKITTNGTGSSYITPLISQTMYYYCEITCDLSGLMTPSTSVVVVVNPVPVLTVTPPTGTQVCSGAIVNLSASGANSYSWTGGNGIVSAAGVFDPGNYPAQSIISSDRSLANVTTVPTLNVNGRTAGTLAPVWTYTVTGTSTAGCSSNATIVLNVITSAVVPQALTFSQSPSPTCATGVPVTLTVNNGGTIGSGQWIYKWYSQDGNTLLQTSAPTSSATNNYSPPTPAANGNYVYQATVTNTSCPNSYAQTTPSFYVGYTATKTITPANCGDNGTVSVFPTGQDNFTTWYTNSFTGLVGGGIDAIFGNATLASGDCRLTQNLSGQNGAFIVKNPGALNPVNAINTNNLQLDFKLTTAPVTLGFSFYGADGMAWSYGPDVTQNQVTIASVGMNAENGSGSGIKLAFDGATNTGTNVNGVYLMYNCLNPDQGPETPGVIAFKRGSFWQGLVNAPMKVVITEDGYISVYLNNALLFDRIQLPPAYLLANKSTWMHGFTARTGGAYQVHAIDDLSIRYNSYQFSANSTNGLDGTWQNSNVLTGLTAGSHPIWVRNPSDFTCVANTGNVIVPSAPSPTVASTVTVSGDNPILCQGSSLSLMTDVFIPGAIFLWESAPSSSGPWTTATGTNNARVYTTAALLEDTWFRCNFTCPAGSMITAAPLLVDVNVGSIASTNSPYLVNCIGKPITMTATPNPFTTLVWYADASGGSPVATGNSYTVTPSVLPTTYYVEPTTTLFSKHFHHGAQTVGLGANTFGDISTTATGSVRFTTTASIIIDSIKIIPRQLGLVTVALQNALSATNLQTFTINVTAADTARYFNVPVNFTIVGAGNYQLTTTSSNGVTCNYWSNYTGPYTGAAYMIMGGGILTVTGSSTSATSGSLTSIYGTVYDFSISSACASGVGTRVPIVVNLNPIAKVNVTPATPTVCQGGVQALNASSITAYSTYNWSPAANLFTDPAATIPYVANTNTANVYLKSFNTGVTPYIIATASGSADGCSNKDSTRATISPAPAVNITSSEAFICPGGNTTLTAASSNSGYSYTWTPGNIANSTINVSPALHTTYTVNAIDNTLGINKGCVTSTTLPVGVTKVGVSAIATPTGICSGDNTQLNAFASTTSLYAPAQASTASPITVPGGGVTVLNNTVGLASGNFNDGYWNVSLPFNFSFYGDLFNTISVNTNGFITLGGGSTESGVGSIPNLTTPNNAIYLAAKDYNMTAGGSIRYFTVGAAPNRRFIIDYLNVPSVSPSGNLNGQIALSESNGLIEITVLGTDAGSLKTLGIENASGTTAIAPSARNGVSWSVSSPEAWLFIPIGGTLSYAWTPAGNLDFADIANPFASSIFSSTTFNVTVTDQASGCSNSASTFVTTGEALTATVSTDQSTICAGQSATMFVTPAGGCSPYTYQWEDPNGIISSFSFVNVSPTTTTPYHLVLTDNVGNEFNYDITINVNPTPSVTVTNGIICGTGTASLTASGANTYSWTPGTSLNATTGATVISSTTASLTYTVTGTTALGCSSKAISTVTVSSPVTVTATALPNTINSGHNSQLSAVATVGGSGLNFLITTMSGLTYTPLSGAGITIINTDAQLTSGMGSTNQDDGGVVINMPFNFSYLGTSYSQMTMCTNGWVGAGNQGTIDASSMRIPGNLFTSTIPNNTLAAWFRDMGGNFPVGTGSMRHGLIGTDVYAFQWDNAVGSSFIDGSAILTSFQINVYGPLSSTPGRIEYIYGPAVGAITTGASIGLEDGTGGTSHYLNALTGTGTSTTTSTAWPGNGNSYRFDAISTPGVTYSWSPATFLSATNIANPVAQSMTSTTTYTVTATTGDGCTATASALVNVGLPFVATATTSANNFCEGGSTTLGATATGGGIPYGNFVWKNGALNVGTGSTVSVIPSVGTTVYTVTVTDADNFSTSATVAVTVKPNPTLSLTKSGDVCGTSPVLLTASGTSTSYSWTPSPTLVVNTPGNTATVTPIFGTTYTVTGTLNGCTTTATRDVNVSQGITISASATPSSICLNGNSQLSATPTAGLSFTWSPATSLSSSTISNPVVTNAAASTNYTVTALNPLTGCTATAIVPLTVGSPLIVTATANDSSICVGQSVNLSTLVNGGGIPYSYSWSNGTSVVGTTANISVSPITSTNYRVTVTDACGAIVQSTQVPITVSSVPTVTVSPANSSICLGVSTSVLLTANGSDTYAWSPAAGLSATSGAAVTAGPTISTVYTVTGTNTATGCSATALATVHLADLAAHAAAYSESVCQGSNSQLVGYGANGAVNYTLDPIGFAEIPIAGATAITTWSNTDVDDGSFGPINLPFTFNFYGLNYNKIYVATNGYISFTSLATTTGVNSRNANNLTTPTVANNIIALCYSDLHASNVGGTVSYFVSGTAPNRVFVVDMNEVFLPNQGRVNGQIQLYENTNVVEVHIQQVDHGTSTFPGATGIENADGTLRLLPAGRTPSVWNVSTPEAWRFSPPTEFVYSWSPTTFLSDPTVFNPTAAGITATTTYTMTATETSSGCQVIDTVAVHVYPLPTASISGTNTICAGASTTLNFNFTGVAPYTYSFTDGSTVFGPYTSAGTSASQSVTPTGPGGNIVTYVLTNVTDVNCSGNAASLTGSAVVTVNSYSSIAGLSLTSDKPFNNICTGDHITLTINGITSSSLGSNAQWKWYSGSCNGTPVPGSTNLTSITVNPTTSTTYYVKAEGSCNTTLCISLPVTVTTAPPSGNPGVLYYPAIAFAGATDSLVVNPVPGATFYRWTTSGNSNILFDGHAAPYEGTSNKVMVTFVSPSTQGNGIGNYHIQFFAGNACGTTNSNNLRIRATVDAPGSLTGPMVACSSQTKSYFVTPVVGAKSYQWSFQSGSGTIAGNGTQNVSVTFTSVPAVLCVHGVSAFNSPGPDICININANPTAPVAITGNAEPCQGGFETYTIDSVPGAISYTWTTTVPGATINGSGKSASVSFPATVFSGEVCVTAYSGCGTSLPTCLSIVSGNIPPLSEISGAIVGVCSSSGVNYQVPSTGATNYLWNTPSGSTISAGQGTNSILVDFSGSYGGGSITILATNVCGMTTDSLEVTGASLPPVITGTTFVCAGDDEGYTASVPGATSYSWSVNPSEALILSTSPSGDQIVLTWLTNGGTLSATGDNSCGISQPGSLTVGSNCRMSGSSMMETLNVIAYPNPSEGRVTLQYNSLEKSTYLLKVTDLTGRILQRESMSALEGLNRHEVDLTSVAKGVYMLSMENEKGESVVIRLVID